MKIELVDGYFLPKDCPQTIYSVEHIRSGRINSLWSILLEAVKTRDTCGIGYHIVAKYRHDQNDSHKPSNARVPCKASEP